MSAFADLANRLSSLQGLALPDDLFGRLKARYDEAHRRYHTWTHVLACLDARHALSDAVLPAVDLALLFHDAVYDPLAADNEARSAALLVEEGRRAWLHEALLTRASAHVLATRHGAGEGSDDLEACLVVAADLSILGAGNHEFAAYEDQIRQEYAMVDDAAFAAGRARILETFLARPAIFASARGRRLWEARARQNLGGAVARWRDAVPCDRPVAMPTRLIR